MALSQNAFALGLDESNRRLYSAVAANGSENAARAAIRENRASTKGPRQMQSKFDGTCRACGQRFPAGTDILWSKETGANHVACPEIVAAPATTRTTAPAAAERILAESDQDAADIALAIRDQEIRAQNLSALLPGTYRVELSGRRDTDAVNLRVTADSRIDGAFRFKIKEDYEGVGRIHPDGRIQIWTNTELSADRIARAKDALDVLLGSDRIGKYGEAYARESGNCYRCSRTLTQEDSLDRGLGKHCAKMIEVGY